MNKKRSWSGLKLWQKAAIIKLAILQIGLFVVAWRDLSGRPATKVNGSKPAWRVGLFFNTIGPLAYFAKGRK